MKLIMILLLTGLLVLSCKKEIKTERSVRTDSVIMDTVRTDTVVTGNHVSPPGKTDTIVRRGDNGSKKFSDTATMPKSKKSK
ncbi:hypothetical protein EG352_02920 [Chryseobacterium indologenes]|uniref:Uncharacterized protein n=1 Tax=Chryseobacterium indologenes TaxID=253 RepID=A0AAD1DUG6_CHRID|nr:hypothetical protein [Chryseobacterium indologenes]AZB16798.1 hypothetical protein EG352_02920 [Chryseobacterium indologenes]